MRSRNIFQSVKDFTQKTPLTEPWVCTASSLLSHEMRRHDDSHREPGSPLKHSHLFISIARTYYRVQVMKWRVKESASLLEDRRCSFHTVSGDSQPLLSCSSNCAAHVTVILYIQPGAYKVVQVSVCVRVPYLFPWTTAPGSFDRASSSWTSSTRVLKHAFFILTNTEKPSVKKHNWSAQLYFQIGLFFMYISEEGKKCFWLIKCTCQKNSF